MINNLNDALNEAKKRRGVFSKIIIWESGVSKSQFYRIIKGQETPSAESKKRISDSLGIETKQFDTLFENSKVEQKAPSKVKSKHKSQRGLIFGGGLMLLCSIFLIVGFSQRQDISPSQTHVALETDKTLFIKDVTIPDGTPIPVNTVFVKTWRVKNTGTVAWEGRYLKRITPASNLNCSSPAMVPIPETLPGEIIDVSVTFKTPHLPGSCRTDWKTSDRLGNLFFPEMHGLFSVVTVVDEQAAPFRDLYVSETADVPDQQVEK